MPTYECIWCCREKSEEEFNVEHVLPQAFGKFENNLTLINTVCKDCNDFFARELEPWLARDSLEGFDRFRYGLKEVTEFKSMGVRSTSRVQISDGQYAGAWGYSMVSDGKLGVRPFPQVGFAQTLDGPFDWYVLDELPSREDLKAKGMSGECAIRFCECGDRSEVLRLLSELGILPTGIETFDPPSGGWVEQVFRPELQHRRALAKIAMNYLASQHGRAIALGIRFDAMRDLVVRGIEPSYQYYSIDEHPIVKGDKKDAKRIFGHMLLVSERPGSIVIDGTVSLYNRFRHGFRLAVRPGVPIEPRGHFFDMVANQIHPMALL